MKRNPESPWNPAFPAHVSPREYERQVVDWLRGSGVNLERFTVEHLQRLAGSGGDYEFDAVAELSILGGAKIVVLVECKRYSGPVEREKVQVLWAKLQDVKAHKAMMFATCGFQSGAIEYATTYGIATITFADSHFTYETFSAMPVAHESRPAGLSSYAGLFMKRRDGAIIASTIETGRMQILSEWLAGIRT